MGIHAIFSEKHGLTAFICEFARNYSYPSMNTVHVVSQDRFVHHTLVTDGTTKGKLAGMCFDFVFPETGRSPVHFWTAGFWTREIVVKCLLAPMPFSVDSELVCS